MSKCGGRQKFHSSPKLIAVYGFALHYLMAGKYKLSSHEEYSVYFSHLNSAWTKISSGDLDTIHRLTLDFTTG